MTAIKFDSGEGGIRTHGTQDAHTISNRADSASSRTSPKMINI